MAKHSHTYRSLSAFIALLLVLTAGMPLVHYACGIAGEDAATVSSSALIAPGDVTSNPCKDADNAISECRLSACTTGQIEKDAAILNTDLSSSRTWLLPVAFIDELFGSSLSPPSPLSFWTYRNVAEDASRPSASIRLVTSTFLL